MEKRQGNGYVVQRYGNLTILYCTVFWYCAKDIVTDAIGQDEGYMQCY